jgi:hypothetical protein
LGTILEIAGTYSGNANGVISGVVEPGTFSLITGAYGEGWIKTRNPGLFTARGAEGVV